MLEPYLDELVIQAPELTIRRIASGEIFVAGISMSGKSNPDLTNWLLRQGKLEIKQAKIVWLDEKRNAASLSLDNLNLTVLSPLWRGLVKNHTFSLSSAISAGTSNPILVSGSFYGDDVSQTEKWHGKITLQLKNANLAAFKTWADYPVDIQSGIGSANISLDFASHQVQSITSNVNIENLQLQTKPDASPITLRKLAGNLNWKNLNKFHLVGTTPKKFGHSSVLII